MASGTFYPVVSGDDTTARCDGSFFTATGNAFFFGKASAEANCSVIRFADVVIPQNAEIVSAYVTFTAYDSRSTNDVLVIIYGNDVDDAVAPTDGTEFLALADTTAFVEWTLAAWTDGTTYNTPSLVSVIQEIVSRGGFVSGNAIQLAFKDNSSTADARRYGSTIDYVAGAEKPSLYIEWFVAETIEDVGMSDAIDVQVSYQAGTSAGISVLDELIDNFEELTEGVGVSDEYDVSPYNEVNEEGFTIADMLGVGIDPLVGGWALTHKDSITAGQAYASVWGDGTFVYAVDSVSIFSYSVDGYGNFTLKDTVVTDGTYLRLGVWGDGTFVYVVSVNKQTWSSSALQSFSVDANGVFTLEDTYILAGVLWAPGVYGDGTFVYVTADGAGLYSFAVDGAGTISLADTDVVSGVAKSVWCDGTFIYVAHSAGLLTYSVDGAGLLTLIDTNDPFAGADVFDVWGDGTFVYCAADTSGIFSFSVDGAGAITYLYNNDQGGHYYGVWGDGSFLYVASTDQAVLLYSIEVTGEFTLRDVDIQANNSVRIWGDGTFIYVAATTGLHSYTAGPAGELVHLSDGVAVATGPAPLTEAASIADEMNAGYGRIISQIGMIYDTVGVGWAKDLEEATTAITDEAIGDVAKTLYETLGFRETIANNWTGAETVQSTLHMFGSALVAQLFNESVADEADAVDTVTYMHRMISAITEALGTEETATPWTTFNPLVTEAMAITGIIAALRTLNPVVSETMPVADTTAITWPKTISDALAGVDVSAYQWMGMHIITESLVATETAIGLFNIDEAVAETLGAAATAVLHQALQESVTEILNFGITLLLDGEVWECWVLSSNAFHVSVYSGFEFNSYAVFNGRAFGCKSDGIFKLSGTTDDGVAFNSGIILPETDFGSGKQKRFRKAFFGISGSSPSIKMESESADVTYAITNSKANLQRNQKSVDWTLKVQGFDDLSFIELVPVILTRG